MRARPTARNISPRAEDRWMKAGSMGRAAAFSFYPGKNLGACGEGGAVTTNDADVVAKVRMLRDHGQVKKYFHDLEGYNGRLDSIQAGILLVKLPHLEEWNQQRRKRAAEYHNLLAGNAAVATPHEPAWSRAVYHLYVVRTANRDGMIEYLKKDGIGTGIHYPVPLHAQKAYASLGYDCEDFPVASKVASEIVSLPMYPQLTAGQQSRVVSEILAFTLPLFLPQGRRRKVAEGWSQSKTSRNFSNGPPSQATAILKTL